MEKVLIDLFREWQRNYRPNVDGALGGYLLKPDGSADAMTGIAMFRDRAAYEANAASPVQDAWFRRLRELLAEDPTWEDGEFVMGGE